MYPSFGGLTHRSRSTTDVYKSSLDDSSYPPLSYSNNRQRKAPEPPRRTDSLVGNGRLKRTRSYLNDDIRRQFEFGLDSPASSPRGANPSPRSENFVKKLVAALERRQEESSGGFRGAIRMDDEFCARPFRQEERRVRDTVPGTREQQLRRERIFESAGHRYGFQRPLSGQLEDLQERDEDGNSDSDPDSYWSGRADDAPNKNSNNNNVDEAPTKSHSRRSLKSMLTSLISWRSGKSLPKGSRDYYAARESLGEEMRAFRRDTMPRLMEHAGIGSECKRRQQREFSEMIGSPRLREEASIATVRPLFGGKAGVQQRLSQEKEPVYGSKKVEPPAVPLCNNPQPDQQLLRPSAIRDIQKRLSQESVERVELRKPRSEIIYDVPTSNRKVLPATPAEVEDYLSPKSVTPPVYENGLIENDKRLHCTMFTTF